MYEKSSRRAIKDQRNVSMADVVMTKDDTVLAIHCMPPKDYCLLAYDDLLDRFLLDSAKTRSYYLFIFLDIFPVCSKTHYRHHPRESVQRRHIFQTRLTMNRSILNYEACCQD